MVLDYFWCPLWHPFPHLLTQCFIVFSGSFEDVSKTRFVLISATFSNVFLSNPECLLERGGQSDICTPFNEKQRLFDCLRPSIFISIRPARLDRRFGGRGGDLTWSHLISIGLTWSHMVSHDLTWSHLVSLGLTWSHLGSYGLTWSHLVSHGLTWFHMVSHGLT